MDLQIKKRMLYMDVGGCHILKDEYLKLLALVHTICSGSSDPFYIVSYYIK